MIPTVLSGIITKFYRESYSWPVVGCLPKSSQGAAISCQFVLVQLWTVIVASYSGGLLSRKARSKRSKKLWYLGFHLKLLAMRGFSFLFITSITAKYYMWYLWYRFWFPASRGPVICVCSSHFFRWIWTGVALSTIYFFSHRNLLAIAAIFIIRGNSSLVNLVRFYHPAGWSSFTDSGVSTSW